MIRVGNGPVCVVQLCLKKRKTNNSRLIYDLDVWNYLHHRAVGLERILRVPVSVVAGGGDVGGRCQLCG